MNRNFILVFILLATFSMINAAPYQLRKRGAIEFQPCPIPDVPTVEAKVVPDPVVSGQPATYTVSGTLSNDITSGKTILAIGYGDPTAKKPVGDLYVQQFTESVKAGSPFTITATNIPTPQLPNPYAIGIIVGDPTDDPKVPIDAYGCTFALVGGSLEEYPIADYPIAGYPIAGYPIAERSYPIAGRSYPIAERSYPIAGRSYPIAERS